MAPLEVIGGGFGRTGTDSLRNALNTLGYNTHHMKVMFGDPEQDPDNFTNAYHNKGQADWDKIFKNYSAAVDWPSVTFYKDLLKQYPDAKVILTVRGADGWYKSVKNTISKSAMALSAGNAAPGAENKNFVDMFKTVCMEGLLMDPERFADEEKVKQLFLDHNEEVKRTVPADQLLIMELGDGWDKLCPFLGKEVPKEPYPHSNSTTEFQKQFFKAT